MVQEEIADMAANAIWSKDVTELSVEELDQLAMLQWEGDPDVEWDVLGLSEDAGDEHGIHTEEAMMAHDVPEEGWES